MRIRIANVVFDAPGETRERYAASAGAIAALYAELLGLHVRSRGDVHREADYPADEWDDVDPLVHDPDPTGVNFAFEVETSTYREPRWPDPDHPQQVHLDVAVPDLEAAEAVVVRHGGRRLASFDDHLVCADAVGHPLCLVPGDPGTPAGRVVRIVFDGFSPRSMARFWGGFLDRSVNVVDTPERVEIGDGRGGPTLAFQHSAGAPPRWPDPAHPQQLHVDLGLADIDPDEARELALSLGAVPLPYLGGGHALADPAGHPFCLCD